MNRVFWGAYPTLLGAWLVAVAKHSQDKTLHILNYQSYRLNTLQ